MWLKISDELESKFHGLRALLIKVRDIDVKTELSELEDYKIEVANIVKEKWELDQLKENPTFRAYRDFFWRIGVDPTKIRPASEALIRRLLRGRSLPKINTFVDAYNLASILTSIPLAAFDEDGLMGDIIMREASSGEEFLGIGMKKPIVLKGGEAVVDDGEKLIAIYPYRDAEKCKITLSTKNVLMLICGVPNINEDTLLNAGRIAVDLTTDFCGGIKV